MDFSGLSRYQDELTASIVPGNDAAISVNGEDVYRYQSGYSDLENKKLMTGEETYFLYSGSKLITTSLGMKLWEEGRLRMDYPVSYYIPEFGELYVRKIVDGKEETVPAENSLLVSHLFTMTAGHDYNMTVSAIHSARKSTEGHCDTLEVVRAMAEIPLLAEPGEMFSYGISHDILAGVIEVITGKKLRDYAEEMIFSPLCMNDTSYGFRKNGQKEKMASQYLYREDLGKPVVMRKDNLFILGDEYDSGGAGVITSLSDYYTFAKMLAGNGKSQNGYRLLDAKTIGYWRSEALNSVQRSQFEASWSRGYTYAMGVQTKPDDYKGIRDFGWGGAAGMKVHISPDDNIAFVYFMHMLNMPDVHSFEKHLRDTAFSCFES